MKTLRHYIFLFIVCISLTACAGNSKRVQSEIVFEPEAMDNAPVLAPEEVAALASEGEIDRNLPSTAMADVTKEFKFYLNKGRKNINASIKQCEKYLPYAKGVFEENGLPKDLAYLAIVESGYRTTAKSHAGAAGAWQFMRPTGSDFGLDQDKWTDDRYDFFESTEAAAKYLRNLHREFNDWPTAIAAYNAGQGKVRRALQESGSSNFFEVREKNESLPDSFKLKEETKHYVPRFLAVVKIMRNLKSLHFPPLANDKAIKVERIVAQPGTDLKNLSKKLGIEWGSFCELNTHHNTVAAISSAQRETYLYVPSGKGQKAKELLAENHKGSYKDWKTCSLGGTETWKKLEKQFNVPQEKLMAMNPGCSLKTGEIVFLPGNAANAVVEKKNIGSYTAALKTKNSVRHILKPHETLYSVAKKYSVSPVSLMKYNSISDPSKMPSGMELRIPGKTELASNAPALGSSYGRIGSAKKTTSNGTTGVYVVQNSDTIWKISRKFNVSVEQLRKWNRLGNDALHAGDRLFVTAE